jgi:hypothetical protein
VKRNAAHLFALSGLAVAQPLYDLLGKNPEFFAVRGSTRWDVILFAVAVLAVPPALLLALELAERRLHLPLVAVLCGLIALQVLKRLGGSAWLEIALAAVLGVAAATAYARSREVRALATVLAAAPPVFLLLFLFSSPVTNLTLEGAAHAQPSAPVRARAPVVLIVFDEFPVNALLDRRGRIDPVRFPHFADLARHATWYRNATTVHDGTVHAIPAILSGTIGGPRALPLLHDYPRNLFTLLGGRYRVEGFESVTHLCPAHVCHEESSGFAARMTSLVEDSSVVYAHVVLPSRLANRLPSVAGRWQHFLSNNDDAEQATRVRRLIASIQPSSRPTLWAAHLLLPHTPWHYLPSGRRYDVSYPVPPWGSDERWTKHAAIVLQNRQRFMLQVGYTDRVLGRLLGKLRSTRLFDSSLVVVTADHGISFAAGGKRRPVWPANLQDIAFVPLLVKYPAQQKGRVVDRHVENVDVVPTIADVLGVRPGWQFAGRSLRNPVPLSRVTVRKRSGESVSGDDRVLLRRRAAALRTQLALFGSDEPASTLYSVGPYRRLLGTRIGHAESGGPAQLELQGDDPVQVSGRLGTSSARAVAVAVRGRVAAVVPVLDGEFWALVPARRSSDLRVFAVTGTPERPRFAALSS